MGSNELAFKLQQRRMVVDQHQYGNPSPMSQTSPSKPKLDDWYNDDGPSEKQKPSETSLQRPVAVKKIRRTSHIDDWMQGRMMWELLLLRTCVREWRATMHVMVLCRPDCKVPDAPCPANREQEREPLRQCSRLVMLLQRRQRHALVKSTFVAWVALCRCQHRAVNCAVALLQRRDREHLGRSVIIAWSMLVRHLRSPGDQEVTKRLSRGLQEQFNGLGNSGKNGGPKLH